MIIEEIDENNYLQANKENEVRVAKKIKELNMQINRNSINWNLFFDPTLWAYKVLKDKQNNPLWLRGFQDKVLNDRSRFVVAVGANQIGKTFSIAVKAVHHALHVNNASVIVVSKSETQAIMILDEIKWMMNRGNLQFDEVLGEVENRTELHLKNNDKIGTSVIRCLPPTTTILGFPATLVICDEIGFWEIDRMSQIEFFYKVIVSRTNETKNWTNNHFTMGQIFCISSPNGQQGALWDLWKTKEFTQYRYNFLANPNNGIEEYERWRDNPPEGFTRDMFDSMFGATFSSASGGFITQREYEDAIRDFDMYIPVSMSVYAGADFAGEDTKGRDVDRTSLFYAIQEREEKKDMIKITYGKEFPIRIKKEEVYEELKRVPNLVKFAYDKVGVGDSVKNDLKERNILSEFKIESLTYSLPNKSEVYYNLKHLFEQRKIIIPHIPKLKEQLLGLRFERTEGGHIKVHHASEGLHDDLADALANACYAARILKGTSPYVGIIERVGRNRITNTKSVILICPECEITNYKGEEGYYRGPGTIHFEKIPCNLHKTETNLITL